MTGDVAQLQTDWHGLSAALNAKFGRPPPPLISPPFLARVGLRAESETLDRAAVEACEPIRAGWVGWLRRESWVGSHREPDPGPSAGAPLDGEWASPDRKCGTRLIYDGSWRLITLHEDPGAPMALREPVRLVAARDAAPFAALRYAVYWGFRPDAQNRSAIARIACRFVGFAET